MGARKLPARDAAPKSGKYRSRLLNAAYVMMDRNGLGRRQVRGVLDYLEEVDTVLDLVAERGCRPRP